MARQGAEIEKGFVYLKDFDRSVLEARKRTHETGHYAGEDEEEERTTIRPNMAENVRANVAK